MTGGRLLRQTVEVATCTNGVKQVEIQPLEHLSGQPVCKCTDACIRVNAMGLHTFLIFMWQCSYMEAQTPGGLSKSPHYGMPTMAMMNIVV